jgi:hypothetical protein
MKSRSPAGPWRRDWPNSGSEKSKKPTLKLLVLRMKHVAKLEDLTRSSESAGKDSEDSRLPMLKGGQNPEGPHVRLVDLMSRRDFGQGKDKRMAMGMKMKDTGLIGAQVEASRLITVGEKFLGGHLFDRIRCRSVVVFSERFATFRRSFFLLRFWRLSYYVSAQHPSSPNVFYVSVSDVSDSFQRIPKIMFRFQVVLARLLISRQEFLKEFTRGTPRAVVKTGQSEREGLTIISCHIRQG